MSKGLYAVKRRMAQRARQELEMRRSLSQDAGTAAEMVLAAGGIVPAWLWETAEPDLEVANWDGGRRCTRCQGAGVLPTGRGCPSCFGGTVYGESA